MIHDSILNCPVRDYNALGSAVERPKTAFYGQEKYPTLAEKAAVLLQSLAMNHPFIDGNKRTAWATTQMFLTFNGAPMKDLAPEDGADFVEDVVGGHLEVSFIAAWISHRL